MIRWWCVNVGDIEVPSEMRSFFYIKEINLEHLGIFKNNLVDMEEALLDIMIDNEIHHDVKELITYCDNLMSYLDEDKTYRLIDLGITNEGTVIVSVETINE